MESFWQYSTVHNSACKVIEEQTLWGQIVCSAWLPNQDAVVRVPHSALRPLSADLQPEIEAGRIAYVAAAARVADALTQDVLLAPNESSVIPSPDQIRALSRPLQTTAIVAGSCPCSWPTTDGCSRRLPGTFGINC